MRKLALATAIATAALSTGAHAAVNSAISSALLQIPVWSSGITTVDCATAPFTPGPFISSLQLAGVGIGNDQIHLVGNVCININFGFGSNYLAFDFDLRGEAVANGTQFNRGTIDVFNDWGTSAGWINYATVNASVDPIDCVATGGVAGLQWVAPPGVNTLPGTGVPACTGTAFAQGFELSLSGTNWY